MTPPAPLRLAAVVLRRKSRNLLLPALLSGAVLLLLLLDHDLQQQHQRPAAQQDWTARLPAALRRNARDRLTLVERTVRAGSAGSVGRHGKTAKGQNEVIPRAVPREEDGATAAAKRSYVSGQRFVDFDPAEEGLGGAAEPVVPAPAAVEPPSHTENASADVAVPVPSTTLQPVGDSASRADGTDLSHSAPQRITHDTNSSWDVNLNAKSGDNLISSSGSSASAGPGEPLSTNSSADSAVNSVAPSSANFNGKFGSASSADSVTLSSADFNTESASFQLPGCSCSRRYSPAALRALNGTRSSCGDTADLRGTRQNVISFSFYGNASSVFFSGIEANLQRVPHVYPGWVVRVYHDIDLSVPRQRQLVCDVQCRYDNVDFCDVRALPGLGDLSKKFGMIWRFMPLADDTVERFIVRDLDSLIGTRERAAVDDWIASNRTFHAMRDAPAHGTEILGGMWGGWNRYNTLYRCVRDRIIKVTQWKFKGLDQRVLTVVLWPIILKHRDLIAHDSYLCYYYPMSRPFPTQRESPHDFVGSPSLLDKGFRLNSHCPYFCRPREHRDWMWC